MEHVDILKPPTFVKSGLTKPYQHAYDDEDWVGAFNLWVIRTEPELSFVFQKRTSKGEGIVGSGKLDVAAELGGHPDIMFVATVAHDQLAYHPTDSAKYNGMSLFARYLVENNNGTSVDAIQKLRRDKSGQGDGLPRDLRDNTASTTFPFRMAVTDDHQTHLIRYSLGSTYDQEPQVDISGVAVGSDSWAIAIDQENDGKYVLRNFTPEDRIVTTDNGSVIKLAPYQTIRLSDDVMYVLDNEGFEAARPIVDDSARCFVVDPSAIRITGYEHRDLKAFLPIANTCGDESVLVAAVLPEFMYTHSSTPDSVDVRS